MKKVGKIKKKNNRQNMGSQMEELEQLVGRCETWFYKSNGSMMEWQTWLKYKHYIKDYGAFREK